MSKAHLQSIEFDEQGDASRGMAMQHYGRRPWCTHICDCDALAPSVSRHDALRAPLTTKLN